MHEPTPSPPSTGRRKPGFKTRAPAAEPSSEAGLEETTAHQPPAIAPTLHMPELEPAVSVNKEPSREVEEPPFAEARAFASAGEAPGKGDDPSKPPALADLPDENLLVLPGMAPSWARQEIVRAPRSRFAWFLLGGILLLVAGGAAGYWLHDMLSVAKPLQAGNGGATGLRGVSARAPERLTAEAQTALDAAFALMKSDRLKEAGEQFGAIVKQHPGWPTLIVEQARSAMYQHNSIAAKSIMDEAEKKGLVAPADAAFISGLLHLAARDFSGADFLFAAAAAADPVRADVYFSWGESLRRQGKPAEAAERYRSAFLRNQYNTAAGYYQLKLWLADLQAGTEVIHGTDAAIDGELTAPHPRGYALVAAAARDVKNGRYAQAAERLRKAGEAIDPPVFESILADSAFVQERWRPEFLEFYPAPPPAPVAAPAKAAPAPSPAAAPQPTPPALQIVEPKAAPAPPAPKP